MLINTEDPSVDVEDMDTSMSYYSNLLSDDPFNLDMECSLPSETDLLQHLSSKLEIPVGLDDDIPKDSDLYDDSSNLTADNVLLEPLLNLLDTEGANWGIDSFPNLTAYEDDPKCKVKMEIKQEEPDSPNALPPSPSSSSSGSINGLSSVDAWGFSNIEPKVVLETPPFSPPVESDNSPPSSPQSVTPLNINNLNIISCFNNANSTNNAQRTTEPIRVAPATLKVVPCARTTNVVTAQRIQPRPENLATPNSTAITTATWSNNSSKSIGVPTIPALKAGEKRKTIVLSAKDFAALAYGARSSQATRVATPSTNATTPVTQTTIRVQPVATASLASQPVPAKVPLIPCQPLGNSVPMPASIPITLASGTVMTSATAPSTTLVPTMKSSVPVKREMEMKAIKRQQRMIKNRESACLSRKKKKEYVSSLENEISKLQQENVQLKLENEALRQQVKDIESISLLTNFPRPLLLSRPKKAATVLCAVLVLFTLNFGSFNGLMGNRLESYVSDVASRSTQVEHHGRTLLWAPNIVDSSADSSDSVNSDSDAMFPPSLHPICPLNPINRTESIRLDSELRRWIGVDVETARNASQPSSIDEGKALNWISSPLQHEKQPNNAPVSQQDFPSKPSRRRTSRKNKEANASPINAVDLYQKTRPPLYEYAAFLDSFPRRQDTFYVVSFSGDHILLPARALNSSIRPKMSLVLPAMPFNASAPPHKPMTMMQIDCEVINTQILQVKETDLPPHVRAKDHDHDHEPTRPFEDLKFAPKKKPASKAPSIVNQTSSQTYNNASLNATTKMDKIDVFANSTESEVVSESLTKINDTNSNGAQSYRPYFVNSDYNPEKFPPSKLNAAFLRSSYSSPSNEYPSVGKRVARFP